MLADVTPALQAEVETLKAELQELSELRALQAASAGMLSRGLAEAQAARTALSKAISGGPHRPAQALCRGCR